MISGSTLIYDGQWSLSDLDTIERVLKDVVNLQDTRLVYKCVICESVLFIDVSSNSEVTLQRGSSRSVNYISLYTRNHHQLSLVVFLGFSLGGCSLAVSMHTHAQEKSHPFLPRSPRHGLPRYRAVTARRRRWLVLRITILGQICTLKRWRKGGAGAPKAPPLDMPLIIIPLIR